MRVILRYAANKVQNSVPMHLYNRQQKIDIENKFFASIVLRFWLQCAQEEWDRRSV
jgi:hypothetical protein